MMIWNVLDFGAAADGVTNDTAAFQRAADACSAAGGGTVLVPAGQYRVGSILLSSGVHMQLEAGSTLLAHTDPEAYPHRIKPERAAVFYADGAQDIQISGSGRILGTGTETFGSYWGVPGPLPFRTGMIHLQRCANVRIEGVALFFSDSWTMHLRQCTDVYIHNVTIKNNRRHLNSDGIDPDSCRNVIISDCNLSCGDDCIVMKTTTPTPCENIVVSNCILESVSTAVKIGTESHGDFRNIRFSNCVIQNTAVGAGIYIKDGATAERISFDGLCIACADLESVKPVIPLYIDIEKRSDDSPLGYVRDVSFTNIQIETGSGALFQGTPERPVENLTLENIQVRVNRYTDYALRKKAVGGSRTCAPDERDTRFIRKPACLACAYVDGLSADNITADLREGRAAGIDRAALYLYRIENARIGHIVRKADQSALCTPVVLQES
jgi:polygalacturonase